MQTVTQESMWTELADGFHEVEMSEYLAWRRVSASIVNKTRPDRSNAWIRNAIVGGHESDDTAARILGSVTHTAVFEPDNLTTEYVVEPVCDPAIYTTDDGKPSSNPRATKKWKSVIKALEDGGRKVVSAEAMRNALAMRDAVQAHKRAKQLLEAAAGPVEISVAATLDIDGIPVPVKVRPDKLHTRAGINVQFKTSQNAHHNSFIWDCWKFGHFAGAELYRRALTAIGWDYKRTCFIVAQTDGFPEVAVYEPDFGMVSAAEDLVGHRLTRIARCIESGVWGSLSENIESISLPHPAWEKIAEETSNHV